MKHIRYAVLAFIFALTGFTVCAYCDSIKSTPSWADKSGEMPNQ